MNPRLLLSCLIFLAGTLPALAQHDHDDSGIADEGGCVVESEPVNPSVVAQMLKHADEKHSGSSILAAPTVASVVGKTSVAVFYLNIDDGRNPSPVPWTPELYGQTRDQIRDNLDWWEQVAAAHGRTAELSMVEYGYDNPVTQLSWDPTATTTPGNMLKDRTFYDTIMNRLGYTIGNSTEKMTAFCIDLAAAEGTDQACIAWIIVGGNSIRSNATFNGPYTNVWHTAARTGYTMAHEMGHIFGAFDEYYEYGTEYSRSRQSRNGAPNANYKFRNHPIVPCMMAGSNREGICSYTSVHTGLSDQVHYTQVNAELPMGAYELHYYRHATAFSGPGSYGTMYGRYQGSTAFPLGAGMTVRITALDSVSDEKLMLHRNPMWDETETRTVELVADTTGTASVTLRYGSATGTATHTIEYLTSQEGPMGEGIFEIRPLGPRSAAVASLSGITVFDDSTRAVLDYSFYNSRSAGFRNGFSVTVAPDSSIYFGTQNSEIVRWYNNDTSRLVGPVASQDYRGVAVTPDGDVWGGCDAGIHRFHGGRDDSITVYNSTNSPLLLDVGWALAVDNDGALWIGPRGRRDRGESGGGLQRFDPTTGIWTDFSDEINSETVNSISIWGDTIAVGTLNGFAIFDGSVWQRFDPSEGFNKNVTAVTHDHAGNLVLATFGGVYRRSPDGSWISYSTANSLLPDDLCMSAAAGPDGTIWVGTVDGVLARIRFEPHGTTQVATAHPARTALSVWPIPASDELFIRLDGSHDRMVQVHIIDATGATAASVSTAAIADGVFRIGTRRLPTGTYTVVITDGEQVTKTRMVVVR